MSADTSKLTLFHRSSRFASYQASGVQSTGLNCIGSPVCASRVAFAQRRSASAFVDVKSPVNM